MTRSGKITLSLLAGAGILVVLLAALVFLGPRLLNTKAVRDLALAELERRTGVHLSYTRAEVTFFPRPRVVIRGVAIDVPGLAAGTVATLQVDLELLPCSAATSATAPSCWKTRTSGCAFPEGEARKSVLRGGVRGYPLFPPLHAAKERARNDRHGSKRTPRALGRGRTDRVPDRTGCPGRLSTGTADASAPLRVPVLGTSFDRVDPLPGGASRGDPGGDGGVPGPRVHRSAGTGRRPLARQNGRFPPWRIETEGLRKLQARATLAGSTITVQKIDLTLAEVGGEASFSDGILTGRGLSARLGNSRVREGTLRLGITGATRRFTWRPWRTRTSGS